MLYETFADSRYCTNEFTRNDRDYPAALELAADIADKLIAAYVRAMTARQQSMDDAADGSRTSSRSTAILQGSRSAKSVSASTAKRSSPSSGSTPMPGCACASGTPSSAAAR